MITWGFVVSYSDLATNDAYFTVNGENLTASYIYVAGSAGDIVWENAYGEAQYLKDVQPGALMPVGARRILLSGTVNGTPRSTTATNIIWMAGNKAV